MAGSDYTLARQLSLFVFRVGEECRALHDETARNTADIAAVATDVDELSRDLANLEAASIRINDGSISQESTYSSSKIDSEIIAASQAVKDDLLGGAGEAYDTLLELAELIQENQASIDTLKALAAGHVKYDDTQNMTDAQKAQARANIGAASSADSTALAGRVTAVEAESAQQGISVTEVSGRVGACETGIAEVNASIGDVNTDFVSAFEASLSSSE